MKSMICDVRRAMLSWSFMAALLATLFAMLLSFGSAMDELQYFYLEGYPPDWLSLMQKASYGEFSALWLPALSALPFAAMPLHELRTGAVRFAVFRAGRAAYVTGKIVACALSGSIVQLAAALVLFAGFSVLSLLKTGFGLPYEAVGSFTSLALARMACGGIWACNGCLFALLSNASGAAFVAPICCCYTLIMIGKRFLPDYAWLNPLRWLMQPSGWALTLLLAACIAALYAALRRRVIQYA